jgi:hypothetical protein
LIKKKILVFRLNLHTTVSFHLTVGHMHCKILITQTNFNRYELDRVGTDISLTISTNL